MTQKSALPRISIPQSPTPRLPTSSRNSAIAAAPFVTRSLLLREPRGPGARHDRTGDGRERARSRERRDSRQATGRWSMIGSNRTRPTAWLTGDWLVGLPFTWRHVTLGHRGRVPGGTGGGVAPPRRGRDGAAPRRRGATGPQRRALAAAGACTTSHQACAVRRRPVTPAPASCEIRLGSRSGSKEQVSNSLGGSASSCRRWRCGHGCR